MHKHDVHTAAAPPHPAVISLAAFKHDVAPLHHTLVVIVVTHPFKHHITLLHAQTICRLKCAADVAAGGGGQDQLPHLRKV